MDIISLAVTEYFIVFNNLFSDVLQLLNNLVSEYFETFQNCFNHALDIFENMIDNYIDLLKSLVKVPNYWVYTFGIICIIYIIKH